MIITFNIGLPRGTVLRIAESERMVKEVVLATLMYRYFNIPLDQDAFKLYLKREQIHDFEKIYHYNADLIADRFSVYRRIARTFSGVSTIFGINYLGNCNYDIDYE